MRTSVYLPSYVEWLTCLEMARVDLLVELVALAKRLRYTRSGKQRSLREISKELAARGFLTERTGKPFVAAQVASMLRGLE